MKIYTKRGDEGQTGLIGGTRVPKYHLRIEAYGTIDELNSYTGFLRDQPACQSHQDILYQIQDRLFTLGSHLASDPEKSQMKLPEITTSDIEVLETSIDLMEETLPQLKNFVLPGGHPANAIAHICRTICRRAERLVVHLAQETNVSPLILAYLNRLSDWFFVFSRQITAETGSEEIAWQPRS